MKKNIVIIDYGVGNTYSIQMALKKIGYESKLSRQENDIYNSTHVILPGVGSFGNAMEKINDYNLSKIISFIKKKNKFILGICLGMQLLLDKSFEFGIHNGLGFIRGEVVKIKERNLKIKLPHIGWNKVMVTKNNFNHENKNKILNNFKNNYFYFVHSYICKLNNEESNLLGLTYYKELCIPAVIMENNILGCQFHPEKSGQAGLSFLKEFVKL